MTITNPLGRLRSQASEPAVGPQLVLTGALAAVVTVAAVFHPTMSPEALLPGVSVLFLVVAAGVALIAWQRPVPARQFSYWDAAGILTLVGILVASAVEPDQMVRLVAGTDRSP
jgi:hypothetical protein